MRARVRRLVERVPPRAWVVVGALVLFAGGFALTVGPLLISGHQLRAEVTGSIPDRAIVGQNLAIELALDNVGDVGISPLCVQVHAQGAADLVSVRFQGIDTEPFHGDEACGGRLNSQETLSLTVLLVPRAAGTLQLGVGAAQGPTSIGPPLLGAVAVSP
jgi:hypothetical protein